MVSTTLAAFADLWAAIIAIELFSVLKLQPVPISADTSTSTQAPTLGSAVQAALLPLATTMTLFTAVELIYHHLPHATAAGAGNRRLSELVTVIMSAAVGLLEFFLFVLPAGGVDLGMAAVEALPVAATVTFFLGMTLIIVHIRAGGEGGGGAVAGNPPVPTSVEMLRKMGLGAAAALVSQMAMALYYYKW